MELKQLTAKVHVPAGVPASQLDLIRQRARASIANRAMVNGAKVPFTVPLELSAEIVTALPVSGVVTPATHVEVITATTSKAQAEETKENVLRTTPVPSERLKGYWELVVGEEQRKAEHLDTIVSLARNKDVFGELRGIVYAEGRYLLDGPPGTGKTTFAKGIADAFSRRVGPAAVHEVNTATMLSQYVGESAKRIASMFAEIRESATRYPYSFLILDEYDAIAGDRTDEQDHKEAKRAVNSLLSGLDSLDFPTHRTFIYGISNIARTTDPAVLRRFDEVLTFDMPDAEMRQKILGQKLAEVAKRAKIEVELTPSEYGHLARATTGYSGSDLARLVGKATIRGLKTGIIDAACARQAVRESKPARAAVSRGDAK